MPVDLVASNYQIPEKILVLAPHPDDFDAMSVTLKYFHEHGTEIHLAVVSSGVSGVDDDFCNPPTPENKTRLREAEQLASCRFFGLSEDQVTFLHLTENGTHHPDNSDRNLTKITNHLRNIRPDTVFLPHGNDQNATHRQTFAFLKRRLNR